jgi:hypothetical protein
MQALQQQTGSSWCSVIVLLDRRLDKKYQLAVEAPQGGSVGGSKELGIQ